MAFAPPHTNGNHATTNGDKGKRPSLFGGLFKSFGRKSRSDVINAGRSQSVSAASPSSTMNGQEHSSDDAVRSLSDTGPFPSSNPDEAGMPDLEPTRSKSVGAILETPFETVRSKSVGDILEVKPETEGEEALVEKLKLQRLDTQATAKDEDGADEMAPVGSAISRHDLYHGLGRQGTKTQWD
jgi:hypothetical protein